MLTAPLLALYTLYYHISTPLHLFILFASTVAIFSFLPWDFRFEFPLFNHQLLTFQISHLTHLRYIFLISNRKGEFWKPLRKFPALPFCNSKDINSMTMLYVKISHEERREIYFKSWPVALLTKFWKLKANRAIRSGACTVGLKGVHESKGPIREKDKLLSRAEYQQGFPNRQVFKLACFPRRSGRKVFKIGLNKAFQFCKQNSYLNQGYWLKDRMFLSHNFLSF